MGRQAVVLSACQNSKMCITLCVQRPADGEMTFWRPRLKQQDTHNLSRRSLLAKCIRFQGSLHRRSPQKHCLTCVDFPENHNWGDIRKRNFSKLVKGHTMCRIRSRDAWAEVRMSLSSSQKSRDCSKTFVKSPHSEFREIPRIIYSLITGHRQAWSLYRAFYRLPCK